MPDMQFGDLTKSYHLPVVRRLSLTNRWLRQFHASRRVRQVRHHAAPRKELTVSSSLRTVTSLIDRVKESHTCPRMTPSIFRRPKATRRGTHRARLGPGCSSTARRSPTPRSPNAWKPVVTSRQPSSRHSTNALTPGMRSSCSRVGGAATTSCAYTGQPAHDCSGTWTGSWRSSAWLTGSKDLSPSQSHPQTPKKPIPAWRGAFLSEVSAAESQKQ